ncbi:hypothetical protein [Vibrio cholerae]|uniref:hypothetical protein n=1 Tax=Vibrio cholerae TaxID=666 RepID=UPI00028DE6E5|nr:hypothetical protein [Vibrio cholerae]EKG63884.1 hypothetical protein VCHC52A1_3460 [Vibrio cholerae HC-52A1]EKG75833.1 hypothetical protein VCHC57A1_3362 [Vibrio cholerae HC-57A1]EMQ61309.1 hypothetical protein VCNHCC008D_003565 [Vibrio cholerae O1 str. NHCC-008D]ERP69075.1 hypothetical protein VCHC36A1_2645 [Vibrio cholerae HC-36A1]MDV2342213.1 hypothetical protein [Vibrio cholerae]
MMDFIIVLKQGRVRAFRVINGQLEVILFAGEKALAVADFWYQFKQKIEYTIDETLALILVSDDSEFVLDPEINIAAQFVHVPQTLSGLVEEILFPAAKVQSYPTLNLAITESKPEQPVVTAQQDALLEESLPSSSLQAFYRKKTRHYQAR